VPFSARIGQQNTSLNNIRFTPILSRSRSVEEECTRLRIWSRKRYRFESVPRQIVDNVDIAQNTQHPSISVILFCCLYVAFRMVRKWPFLDMSFGKFRGIRLEPMHALKRACASRGCLNSFLLNRSCRVPGPNGRMNG
jgi:hypothetical protein